MEQISFYCPICKHTHERTSKIGKEHWSKLNDPPICFSCSYYQFGKCRQNVKDGSTRRTPRHVCPHFKKRGIK